MSNVIELVSQVSVNDKTMYDISNTYNCGQLVINIDESQYTEQMKLELVGLLFRLYVKVDEAYISYNNRTILWNTRGDLSLPVQEVPQNVYVLIEPIVDKVYLENNGLSPTEVFPISIYFIQ